MIKQMFRVIYREVLRIEYYKMSCVLSFIGRATNTLRTIKFHTV